MSSGFQDRLNEIERRKTQQRKETIMTAIQRIELERAGGDRRVSPDRRRAEIRGKPIR